MCLYKVFFRFFTLPQEYQPHKNIFMFDYSNVSLKIPLNFTASNTLAKVKWICKGQKAFFRQGSTGLHMLLGETPFSNNILESYFLLKFLADSVERWF